MTSVADARASIEALDDSAVLISIAEPDAEEERHALRGNGALAGEAIVVKDCIGVPGFNTTAATPLLRNYRKEPGQGITRLLAAGAVVVATASMHELAFGVTGGNSWRGTPANPAAPDRLPGGSSSGSAIAVTRGIVDVAIGTDTGGSSRIPAACCGIVGFRPSTGRYPADGLITLSETRDTLGILARSIHDVVRFDSVLSGSDAYELGSSDVQPTKVQVVAIPDETTISELEDDVAAAFQAWVSGCREAGLKTITVDIAPLLDLDDRAGFPIALRETVLQFERLAHEIDLTYEEFVAGVASDDVRALLQSEAPTAENHANARDHLIPEMLSWYDGVLGEADLFAWPTMPVLPPRLHESESMVLHGQPVPTFPTMTRFTSPASLAGVPSLSVPLSTSSAPVSVMLEGRRGADFELLSQARSLFPAEGVS